MLARARERAQERQAGEGVVQQASQRKPGLKTVVRRQGDREGGVGSAVVTTARYVLHRHVVSNEMRLEVRVSRTGTAGAAHEQPAVDHACRSDPALPCPTSGPSSRVGLLAGANVEGRRPTRDSHQAARGPFPKPPVLLCLRPTITHHSQGPRQERRRGKRVVGTAGRSCSRGLNSTNPERAVRAAGRGPGRKTGRASGRGIGRAAARRPRRPKAHPVRVRRRWKSLSRPDQESHS